MNDEEARASGRKVSKATVPTSAVTRAQLEGETDRLVNILVDTESQRFLGASVLAITGDEIVVVDSAKPTAWGARSCGCCSKGDRQQRVKLFRPQRSGLDGLGGLISGVEPVQRG